MSSSDIPLLETLPQYDGPRLSDKAWHEHTKDALCILVSCALIAGSGFVAGWVFCKYDELQNYGKSVRYASRVGNQADRDRFTGLNQPCENPTDPTVTCFSNYLHSIKASQKGQ